VLTNVEEVSEAGRTTLPPETSAMEMPNDDSNNGVKSFPTDGSPSKFLPQKKPMSRKFYVEDPAEIETKILARSFRDVYLGMNHYK
jgi:hypothetical protein